MFASVLLVLGWPRALMAGRSSRADLQAEADHLSQQHDQALARAARFESEAIQARSKLAEAMRGSILVESAEGGGTTFRFQFKAMTASSDLRPGASGSEPLRIPIDSGVTSQSNTPLRILLAEDNKVNQRLGLMVLQKLGYQADIVSNGREALQALERERYDVVLMDVQMPEMDGLEATREIRRRWPAKSSPWIIALTANAMEGDRETCLGAGMDGYLTKPMKVPELQSLLEQTRTRERSVKVAVKLKKKAQFEF